MSKNYADLSEMEFVKVVAEFAESWVTGLSRSEIESTTPEHVKIWMTTTADDARYNGDDWADMINEMSDEELDELSSAVARRAKEDWLSDEEDDEI